MNQSLKLRAGTALLIWMTAWPVAAQSAPDSQAELHDYVIQPGDTCARVAQCAFGDSSRYDIIHAYNPGMGPTPHHLVPGQTLRLPRAAVAHDQIPDARVTATTRDVRAREPDATDWSPARRGLGLFRAWRVNTLEQSRAEVTFQDTAVLQMRADTLVIIYGASARSTRSQTGRAALEQGTLRGRLGELRGTISTPSASIALGGGEAVLGVDAEGTSRLSNHEGGAATLRSNSGGEVQVRPGFGSKVVPRRRPTPPRPLPPAPTFAGNGPTHFAGIVGQGGTLRGAWLPVANARSYRIEVSTEPDGRGVVAAVEVPAEIRSFEIRRLPAGQYYVRLATIDGDFFESRTSDAAIMTISLVQLAGTCAPVTREGEVDLLPDETLGAEPTPLALLTGTRVVVPDGMRCSMGQAAPSESLTLTAPLDGELHCVEAAGASVPGPALHVWAPTLGAGGDADSLRLARGEEQTLDLRWQAEGPLPQELHVEADEGVEVISTESLQHGAGLRVRVRALESAPESVGVRLVAGDEATLLASASIGIQAPVVVAPDPPAPAPTAPRSTAPRSTVPRVAQEALGLMPTPWLSGLVDPYRGGSGALVSGSLLGVPGAEDAVLRGAAGGELSLGDSVRVGAVLLGDGELGNNAPTARGHADYRLWASLELIDPTATRARAGVELAVWVPTGVEGDGIEHARLMPSFDLGLRHGGITLRSRQGAIFDTTSGGTFAWTSAMGIDLALLSDDVSVQRNLALSLGIELDSAIGTAYSELYTAVAVGFGFALRKGPVSLSLGARYHLTDDLDARMGRMGATLGLRVTMPR